LTSTQQKVVLRSNDGVTVVTTVINRVACIYYYGCQTAASIERRVSNYRDGIGDGYRGQTATSFESSGYNCRDRIRNGYGGKTTTSVESSVFNCRDGIGDYCCLTPPNQGAVLRSNDGIAVVATVINRVVRIDYD